MEQLARAAFSRFTVGAAVLLALGLASPAAAGTQVARKISYGRDSGATEAVKGQCHLESRVPEFVKQFAADVELVDSLNTKRGRALDLSITEVHAPGGGAFSGPKWMTVYGKLYDRGKLVGSFRAKRFSTGGVFNTFKGTCSILGRCAKAIGMDVGKWLEKPSMNAELGNAR